MKTAEIVKDQFYSMGGRKVLVLETGLLMSTRGYTRNRSKGTANGVRVVNLDRNDNPIPRNSTPAAAEGDMSYRVTSRDIERPWSERDEERRQKTYRAIRAAEDANDKLTELGFKTARASWRTSGNYELSLRFEGEEVHDVLKALEAQSKS